MNNVVQPKQFEVENQKLSGFKGGEPPSGENGMKQRITRLEGKFDLLESKGENLGNNMDKQFERIDKRFDKLETKIDQLPTKEHLNISISDNMKSIKIWFLSVIIPMTITLAISLLTLGINLYKLF